MLGGDGMSFNTRVPAARRAWVRMGVGDYAMSCPILNELATQGSWL
jgi:hypothetical protein